MNTIVSLNHELYKAKYMNKAYMIKCDLMSFYINWLSDLRPDKQTNFKSDTIAKETDSTGVSWLKAKIIHGIHVILLQYNLCVCNPLFYCTDDQLDCIDREILIGFFKEEVETLEKTNPISLGALWKYYVSMTERINKVL